MGQFLRSSESSEGGDDGGGCLVAFLGILSEPILGSASSDVADRNGDLLRHGRGLLNCSQGPFLLLAVVVIANQGLAGCA